MATGVAVESLSRRILPNSAAPTSGTWQLGDTIINNGPTAGSVFGWRCVAAGTPGTWEAVYTLISTTSALTQTYSAADATLSAYTANAQSSAYTGAADSEAKLADLNSLRVAYENLRAFTEDLAQFVNSLVDQLQARDAVG